MANLEGKYLSVDLKKEIEKYIWRKFLSARHLLTRPFYRRNRYKIEIRWAYFEFEDKEDVKNILEKPTKKTKKVLTTNYENNSEQRQEYTFNAQGQKMDNMRVSLKQDYTIGGNINLDLRCIAKLSAGMKAETKITHSNFNEFNNSLAWSTSTKFDLEGKKRAKASIQLEESLRNVDFVLHTTVSIKPIALGRGAPVTVYHRGTNTQVYYHEIVDLHKVFGKYENTDLVSFGTKTVEFKKSDEEESVERQTYNAITITTFGTARVLTVASEKVVIDVEGLAEEGQEPDQTEAGD